MARPSEDFGTVVSEFATRLGDLQSALRECLEATLPSLDGARACARALGLKRGLGWKAYTIATSHDQSIMLEALPRRPGWNTILASLRAAKCPAQKLRALAESVDAVLEGIESGRVGPPLLRVLAAGRLDGAREAAALRRSRRAVRVGSERIYGVRCEYQVGTWMVGAADARGRVDLVSCMEYEGLMRLRPGPPVAIQRRGRTQGAVRGGRSARVRLGTELGEGWLAADLSTPGVWNRQLRCDEAHGDPVAFLESGTTGMKAPIRAVFADFIRGGGTLGGAEDEVDLQFGPTIPVAHVAYEVWVHRTHRLKSEPSASLVGSTNLLDLPIAWGGWSQVPLPLEAQAVRAESPALPASLRPMNLVHAEVLRRAAAALRADLSEFVGFRIALPDPLIGFRVAMRWRM